MDLISVEARSRLMGRIGPKDTLPELAVRKAVHARCYRYRLHYKKLPGRPDLAFPARKLAIFVHGCFWHRHDGCKNCTTPKTRPEFWSAKFESNRARDQRVNKDIEKLGWGVFVIWECQTANAEVLASRLDEIFALAPGFHIGKISARIDN